MTPMVRSVECINFKYGCNKFIVTDFKKPVKLFSSQQKIAFMKNPCLIALVLIVPLASFGDTIFDDTTFSTGGSTYDATATPPTATSTSYENWETGHTPQGSIAANALNFQTASGTSGFSEIEALFTSSPVTLATVGDYVDVTITFKDSSNVLLTSGNINSQMDIGLYYSGGVSPSQGGNLSAGTAATGGANGYVGYVGRIFLNGNANVITRPVQSGAGNNSSDQDLLFDGGSGNATYANPTGTSVGTTGSQSLTGLTQGNTYTEFLQMTLSAGNTLTITNALFGGTGLGGTLLAYDGVTASSPSTEEFDALAFGYRYDSTTTATSGLSVSEISVSDLIQIVPEPTVFALSAFGGLGLLAMRRWKRRK
ncbi:MAG TPA: hypothetical protein VGH42_01530 [Verrucomicrobiae bacterium]